MPFMNSVKSDFLQLREDERMDEVNEQIRLIQKKQGLTFGTDAFLLAAYVSPKASVRVADLGSGTGILPLLLTAKGKAKRIFAIEVQKEFAELIDRNAALNGYADRISSVCADIRDLNASDLGGEMDLVVSNPPYMRCDSGKRNERDEKYIARHEVCGNIYDFCACAGRLLRFGGKFVSVWRPDRLIDLVDALRRAGLEPKRMTFVHADQTSVPCMVLTEAVRGAAPSLSVSPPLFLYLPHQAQEKSRVLTQQAQLIYDTCNFSDCKYTKKQ